MINSNFLDLKREYIFPIIEKKLEILDKSTVINLGIGDIAFPLAPSIVQAICEATEEMGKRVIGYGPSEGYMFLRKAIAEREYTNIAPEEIFISDGINTDTGNIHELFKRDSTVAVADPAYPVYLDTNIIAGNKVHLLPCTEDTRFVPRPPSYKCDVVYLCSPNNPTGVAMNYQELEDWIAYAKKWGSILLIDNAYAAFIRSKDVPKTIYEIPGARDVAIEFKSFSKTAGFTGLRCAYTVVPKNTPFFTLWKKRQNIKSNGVSYPIQKGALASLGCLEAEAQVESYLAQASRIKNSLQNAFGGIDSPYIWWKTPQGLSSWEFFDLLLAKCGVLCIPGSGFGKSGEGFVRLSAFTTEDKARFAVNRLSKIDLH